MKVMKFLTLSLLAISSISSAKINVSAGIMRGQTFSPGSQLILELNQRQMYYFDENIYIEVEMIEEKDNQILLEFTIATKNESGSFIVRGLPKLSFLLTPESKVTSGSLRCDGPSEILTFTLVVTVEKL